MTLEEHYVTEEIIKSVTGKIVLDLWPKNIEKVFHLPKADQYLRITYDRGEWWYKDNLKEAEEIVQSSFLIDKIPMGCWVGKVDMTRGYMKDDIEYAIMFLSRAMGLPAAGHLQTWMVHFIETIQTAKMPTDWTTILSDNLDEQLCNRQSRPTLLYDIIHGVFVGG